MGFFSRFSKKVEAINRGEADPDTLNDEMYLEDDAETAQNEWRTLSQRLLINAQKAVDLTAERVFIVLDFTPEHPQMNLIYQMNGQLIDWHALPDATMKDKIQNQLVSQIPEAVAYINDQFVAAKLAPLTFVELQLEMASSAWFSHIVRDDSFNLTALSTGWLQVLEKCHNDYALDSDKALPWFPEIND